MKHDDPELPPELQRGLSALERPHAPPGQIEDQIVTELRRRGAFAVRRRPAWRLWTRRAAAAVVLLGMGYLAGRASGIAPTPTGERYLLLLVGDVSLGDREKERRFYDEYAAWAGKLKAERHLISAARLDDPRPSLDAAGGTIALPSEPVGPGVSGFFLIAARDEQEALALARESPHLKYGGRIEVRHLVGRP